jgi:hypothetical protein
MARAQSPGYPNFPLQKGIEHVRSIFSEDRRNPIDREVAAKHLGYSGLSGASDKVLGSLGHYGLLEKAGKGQVRVSQIAVDILHPESPEGRKKALQEAAFCPAIFSEIREHFTDGPPSEGALKSWLMREEFLDRAINPVTKAYLGTCQYLEQEKAIESSGPSKGEDANWDELEDAGADDAPAFGGAKVGDLIQWESNGQLQFETPKRVRWVHDDGQWLAVEGSDTGIPMQEVKVENISAQTPPPMPHIPPTGAGRDEAKLLAEGESEWIANKVGKSTKVRLLVSGGEMGPKEIGKLITLLQAQKLVLEDDESDE